MEQQAIKIGNSVGVIIPQNIRRTVGIKNGDKIMVKTQGKSIILDPIKKKESHGVNAKFAAMVDEFMTEHDDVLKKLAHR